MELQQHPAVKPILDGQIVNFDIQVLSVQTWSLQTSGADVNDNEPTTSEILIVRR
jgi:hypothetical protein